MSAFAKLGEYPRITPFSSRQFRGLVRGGPFLLYVRAGGIPNYDSIEASTEAREELPGIREVPVSELGNPGPMTPRIERLAEAIRESEEITPLIVVIDAEGPYVLEGSHRFPALVHLGFKVVPALVVRDLSE